MGRTLKIVGIVVGVLIVLVVVVPFLVPVNQFRPTIEAKSFRSVGTQSRSGQPEFFAVERIAGGGQSVNRRRSEIQQCGVSEREVRQGGR